MVSKPAHHVSLNSLLVALAKFTIGERLHEKSPPNIHYPGPPWNSCPQSSHKTAAEGHRNRLSRVMDLGNHCLKCRWQENRRRSMLRPNLHRAGTNAAGLEKQWKREHAWWPDLLEKKERQKKKWFGCDWMTRHCLIRGGWHASRRPLLGPPNTVSLVLCAWMSGFLVCGFLCTYDASYSKRN